MYKLTTIIVIAMLIAGCGGKTSLTSDIYITNDTKMQMMPLYSGIEPYASQQKISVNYNESEYTFIVVLSVNPSEITIALLGDFGRLLTATYNGKKIIYEKSSFVPDTFPLEYMFSDIQLIIYPIDALEQYLPKNIHAEESTDGSAKTRTLFNNGKAFALIKYYGNTVEFSNIERNYNYIIEEI